MYDGIIVRSPDFKILATCAAVLLLVGGAAAPPAREGHWALIWGDEFDGRHVDAKKWLVADTHGRPQYDGELNSYDPDEVGIANGQLILRTREFKDNKRRTAPYVSGRVSTKNKFAFLYGRVDVRAKFPGTRGVFPAIWLLPAGGAWPPEIDIAELLGQDPTRVYMTDHWGTRRAQEQSQSDYAGPDFTADFHVFTLEWMPGKIRWLIDGVERKSLEKHVPDKAMFLIINTAVGGDWAGPPDRHTTLPQQMLVDYVRVYQHRK